MGNPGRQDQKNAIATLLATAQVGGQQAIPTARIYTYEPNPDTPELANTVYAIVSLYIQKSHQIAAGGQGIRQRDTKYLVHLLQRLTAIAEQDNATLAQRQTAFDAIADAVQNTLEAAGHVGTDGTGQPLVLKFGTGPIDILDDVPKPDGDRMVFSTLFVVNGYNVKF